MKRKTKITFEIEELTFFKIRKSFSGFSELDKPVLSQAVIKKQTEKDGEDVLTPTILDEIAKKQSK